MCAIRYELHMLPLNIPRMNTTIGTKNERTNESACGERQNKMCDFGQIYLPNFTCKEK